MATFDSDNFAEICKTITDNKDLKLAYSILNRWQRLLREEKNLSIKSELAVGDRVKLQDESVKSSHKLSGVLGTIEKINKSKIKVTFDGHELEQWDVPMTMIEKVTA